MSYINMNQSRERRNAMPKFEDKTRSMKVSVSAGYIRKGEFALVSASIDEDLHVEVKLDSEKKVVAANVLNDSFDFVCKFLGTVEVR